MSSKIKILIVEHNLNDIELIQYELKKGGIDFVSEIVQSEMDYCNALKNFIPDIILSDYALPSFDGRAAFEMRAQITPGTPFIFVSGSIGEENSIEFIKKGVTDYALKDKLFTLSTKVKRALSDAKEKQEKNKTEQELLQSERRLARAQELAHMGSWEIDMIDNTQTWSDGMYKIYGIDHKEHPSTELFLSFIHPDDLAFSKGHVVKAYSNLSDGSFNFRFTRKDGELRYGYTEYRVDFDQDKRPVRLYGIVRDISEKKKAEENLARSESSLREAQAIAHVGNCEIDMVYNSHYWSDEIYKIFGISKGEVTPSEEAFMSFFHPDDLKYSYEKIDKGFETLQNISFDFRFIRKDGVVRYGYNEWKFKFDKNGKPAWLFRIFQDITERKLAETERIKIVNDLMQRNKDLEQFAYIVSHNLRAPVANILGACSGLNYPGLSKEKNDILSQGLTESVTRLDEVIKDLNHILQVKREINEIKEKVCFSELVDNIKISIKNLIDKDIEIKYDFSEIDEFLTLKSYMYSIFYNLISNSIKYRQQQVAGIMDIKSHRVNGTMELIFTDNGMGIDLQKKGGQVFGLYNRFHTNIEGKGIGLFMVKTQVETLGGKISIRSEVNKGTEFKIEFEI